MIKSIFNLAMVAIMVLVMTTALGCESSSDSDNQQTGGDTGTLTLNLTDAPADSDEIAAVYIAIKEIQVNKSTGDDDANWETVKEYTDAEEFNLLELTGGEFALLGKFDLTAGQYNQIRFILDIQEQGENPPSNLGCYVEFTDDEKDSAPLFVPSGEQSGYKAVGAFEVPVNGDVDVTVDFDVRKALHVTGNGNNQRYILKPTLRLIVDSEAGKIDGTVTLDTTYTDIIVFAYEDGEWTTSEAEDPADGESRFPNAVSSYKVNEDSEYILAYLAQGTYDLVVAGYNGDTFGEVLGTVSDVVLDSNHTAQDITSSDLDTA